MLGPFEEEEDRIGIASDRARGQRRGFIHGAAARHSHSARAQMDSRKKRFFGTNFWVEPVKKRKGGKKKGELIKSVQAQLDFVE